MAIKIAVTAQNRKTISNHAGACRNYFIYTINNDGSYERELLELAKDESLRFTFHDDESDNPKNKIFEMDIVLTGGIGQGGVNKLAQRNVIAKVIQETDPDVAIEKYLNRTLEFFEPENHHQKGHNH